MRRALITIACLVACATGSARAQSTAVIRQVFKCVDTSTGLYHVCPGATADQSAYQQLGAAVAATMSIPSAAQLAQMQADVTSAKAAVQSLTPLAQGALPASALDTANGAAKLDAQKRLAYPVVGDVSAAAAATGRTVGALSSLVDSHTSAIAAKAAQSDLTAEANTARSAEQANASAAQAAQSAAAAAQTAAASALPASSLDSVNGAAKLDAQKRLAYPVIGDVSAATAATGRTVGALSSLVDGHTSAIATKAAQADLTSEANTARAAEQANATAAQAAQAAANAAATPAQVQSTIAAKIGQPSGIAGLNPDGALAVPVVGSVSAAPVTAASPGALPVSEAMRAGDRPTVRDYSPTGAVGGGLVGWVSGSPQGVTTLDVFVPPRVLGQPQPLPAVGEYVSGPAVDTSQAAPTVTSVSSDTKTVTLTLTSSAATLIDADEPLTRGSTGLASNLHFASAVAAPIGATVTGSGVPTGTYVTLVRGGDVFLSNNLTTSEPSGTSYTITYETHAIGLSKNWAFGQDIGFYTQDDYKAFSDAVWKNDGGSGFGGAGGQIYVPSGTYFLSQIVYSYDSTSFVFGPNVIFLPGSASIAGSDGTFPSVSHMSIIGQGQNISPVELNISQLYRQRKVLDVQGQAINVSQSNLDCVNDGGPWGCGMVAQDIKQSVNPYIRRGAMWAYHVTDTQSVGQHISWAGAELEYVNEGGWWSEWLGDNLDGNIIGAHLDNTADYSKPEASAGTVAIEPAGLWHIGLDCGTNILHWCFQHTNGSVSNQQPIVDAGLDNLGRSLANAYAVERQRQEPNVQVAALKVASINNDGSVGAASVNTTSLTNSTGAVASVTIEDGGRTNAPLELSVGAPPSGGTQATATVSAYTLRAVQSMVAINATNHGGAPDGVTSGMVFSLAGGTCSTQPQVTYDGAKFIVSQAGTCSVLPGYGASDANLVHPNGMERASLTLSYVSGGSAAPTTLPVIEPLYAISGITVSGGAGYNVALAPEVFAHVHFDTSTGQWAGIEYTPPHLTAVMGQGTSAPISAPAFQIGPEQEIGLSVTDSAGGDNGIGMSASVGTDPLAGSATAQQTRQVTVRMLCRSSSGPMATYNFSFVLVTGPSVSTPIVSGAQPDQTDPGGGTAPSKWPELAFYPVGGAHPTGSLQFISHDTTATWQCAGFARVAMVPL